MIVPEVAEAMAQKIFQSLAERFATGDHPDITLENSRNGFFLTSHGVIGGNPDGRPAHTLLYLLITEDEALAQDMRTLVEGLKGP